MIVADTSGLLALFNRAEPNHEAVRTVVEEAKEPLLVSPYVVAEVDYLVATRLGVDAELAVLRELSGGAYVLVDLSADDLARTADVIDRYRDQAIGVADASQVVLADRHATDTVLTLDRRHFGVLRTLGGGVFRMLP